MASAACTALRCTAPTGAVLHAPQIRHGTWNGTGRRPRVVCVWGGPVADALLSPEVLFSLCSVCCAIHGYYSAKGAIIDGMPGDDRVLTSPPCPPQVRGPAHGEPQSRPSTLPRRRPLLIEIEMMHCTATALQLPPPATAAHCALAASAVHVQHRLVRARFSSRHHHWAVDPAMVVVHAVQRRYLQKSVCRLQRHPGLAAAAAGVGAGLAGWLASHRHAMSWMVVLRRLLHHLQGRPPTTTPSDAHWNGPSWGPRVTCPSHARKAHLVLVHRPSAIHALPAMSIVDPSSPIPAPFPPTRGTERGRQRCGYPPLPPSPSTSLTPRRRGGHLYRAAGRGCVPRPALPGREQVLPDARQKISQCAARRASLRKM